MQSAGRHSTTGVQTVLCSRFEVMLACKMHDGGHTYEDEALRMHDRNLWRALV